MYRQVMNRFNNRVKTVCEGFPSLIVCGVSPYDSIWNSSGQHILTENNLIFKHPRTNGVVAPINCKSNIFLLHD